MKKLLLFLFGLVPLFALSQVTETQTNTDINAVRIGTNTPVTAFTALTDLANSKISVLGYTTTGTNAYVISINPKINTYVPGLTIPVYFANTNTGASTLVINSLPAKSIVKNVSDPLVSGDIPSGGRLLWVYYDGTNFRVSLPSAGATFFSIVNNLSEGVPATMRSNIGLGNVENTALSTWAGTTNLTTLGTIVTGTWNATAIADAYISSASTWNAKETVLTFTGPLSRSVNTISIPVATNSVDGYLSAADRTIFNTAYTSRISSFTTTGTNGASTFSGNVLNIPNYSISGLGGVPSTRNINTTSPITGGGDLSADRTIAINNAAADGSTKGAATFTAADFNDASGVISFDYTNSQKATGSVPGILTAADWTTFNGKQAAGNYITALTGDATASGPGSAALTFATVNSNTGSWGTTTQVPQFTVNGKGLITVVSNVTITPAVGSITGLGTGVPAALIINVGTAGAFVVNGGALGTPSSGVGTNLTGTAAGLTAGNVTTNANLIGDVTSSGNATTYNNNVPLNKGGTNAALTASNGGIFYSTGSAGAILSGVATASKMLLSGSTAAPTWSTSTIPTSAGATANKALISDGTNYVLANVIEPNSANTGDVQYASSSNTYANLAANATATKMYLQSVSSGVPLWQQISFADLSNQSSAWLTASGGTLTGANTIAQGTNLLAFTAALGTVGANNTYVNTFTYSSASRTSNSDVIGAIKIDNTVTAAATGIGGNTLFLKTTYKTSSGITTGVNTGLQNPAQDWTTKTLAGMTVTTTFSGVSATSTSGSGTGAVFTVITNTATTLTSINCTTSGSGYNQGETVTFNGSLFGGSGLITVSIASTLNNFGTNAAPLVINNPFSDYNGLTAPMISFTKSDGITQVGGLAITYAANLGSATKPQLALIDPSGTMMTSDGTTIIMNRALNMSSNNISNASTISGSSFTSVTMTQSGGYTNSATVANATTNTAGATMNFTGALYASVAGNVKSNIRAGGSISTGVPFTYSVQTAGSGYTNGGSNVTGGTGTGASVTLTTSSGTVTAAVPLAALGASGAGSGYVVNDVLNLTQAGGSGGQIKVTAVDGYGGIMTFAADQRTITDPTSNNIYTSLYSSPTINITSSQSGSMLANYYNATHTSTGSFAVYNYVYANAASKGGIGNSLANVNSTWDVNGRMGWGTISSSGSLSLDNTFTTLIIASGTGTYTLPSAAGATRGVYIVVNQTGGARTISTYKDKSNASQTTIGATTALWLQSDGTNWNQINN